MLFKSMCYMSHRPQPGLFVRHAFALDFQGCTRFQHLSLQGPGNLQNWVLGRTLQTVNLHHICDSGRQVLDQNIDRMTGANSRHQGGEGSQQKKAWRCYYIHISTYLPAFPKGETTAATRETPPQAPHIPSLHAEVHDVTIQVGKLALETQEGLPRQRRFRGFRGFRV